ncbi:MAG TPA: hypothetical protein VG253_24235 [Streptosporangiaceae bacterium]|jgi:hypothetical protein|nr:hypothetical protein [Streptosporangiaceae bacterium]
MPRHAHHIWDGVTMVTQNSQYRNRIFYSPLRIGDRSSLAYKIGYYSPPLLAGLAGAG